MNSADFEEGEISEESEDESEAVAAMIIAPRLQTRRTASPISHLPTPPADDDEAQIQPRLPGETLQHLIGREVEDVQHTATSSMPVSWADASHFRDSSPPGIVPQAAEMAKTISCKFPT
jgi:hypothetical protein